jgi:hypothetical protein
MNSTPARRLLYSTAALQQQLIACCCEAKPEPPPEPEPEPEPPPQEAADLEVTKAFLRGPFQFTTLPAAYAVTVVNRGPDTARNVVLVDDFPPEATALGPLATLLGELPGDVEDAILGGQPFEPILDAAAGQIKAQAGDLEKGQVVLLVIPIRFPSAPEDLLLVNRATVQSDTLDPGPGPNTIEIETKPNA